MSERFRVLVVEDEPNILRHIVQKIEAADSRFQVTDQVLDGREALSVLGRRRTEVVFTDIQMPGLGGLDLIRTMRADTDVPVVIISGFHEFQYAREALTLGVEGQSSALRGRHGLFLICAGHLDTRLTSTRSRWYEGFWEATDWKALVRRVFGAALWTVLDEKSPNQKLLVVSEGDFRPLEKAARLVESLRETAGGFPVNVGTSQRLHDTAELRQESRALRLLLERSLIMGRSRVWVEEKPPASPHLDLTRQALIASFIQAGSRDALRAELLSLFREWDQTGHPQRWIEQALHDLTLLFRRQKDPISDDDIFRMDTEIQTEIALSPNFRDLSDFLWELYDENLVSRGHEGSADLVDEIARFLEAGSDAPVSLEAVASKFHLSPASLTRAFRKHRGGTPLRYLIQLRIEKAKTLLSGCLDLEIKDVAEMVGYQDQHYFSRLFKSVTGTTPTLFREGGS